MINFDQDAPLDSFEWEYLLFEFIKRNSIGFIKMELLMLFYRNQSDPVKVAEIVTHTGYRPAEVSLNIAKLVGERLLGSRPAAVPEETVYHRLEAKDFSGRNLVHQILERMAVKFNEREGRLKIIYAILKAQD
jgi:DNA-binding MarR family transcriptional regulator